MKATMPSFIKKLFILLALITTLSFSSVYSDEAKTQKIAPQHYKELFTLPQYAQTISDTLPEKDPEYNTDHIEQNYFIPVFINKHFVAALVDKQALSTSGTTQMTSGIDSNLIQKNTCAYSRFYVISTSSQILNKDTPKQNENPGTQYNNKYPIGLVDISNSANGTNPLGNITNTQSLLFSPKYALLHTVYNSNISQLAGNKYTLYTLSVLSLEHINITTPLSTSLEKYLNSTALSQNIKTKIFPQEIPPIFNSDLFLINSNTYQNSVPQIAGYTPGNKTLSYISEHSKSGPMQDWQDLYSLIQKVSVPEPSLYVFYILFLSLLLFMKKIVKNRHYL